ncbi:MAG TPA: hypothetical protein VK013_00770 [Myxococcaceae bacterium]|nr:hypothetical protein [Myxococcaceae bacterium]
MNLRPLRRGLLTLTGLAALSGCVTTPDPLAIDEADRAFVSGRNDVAATSYASLAERNKDPDAHFRARLFALFAQRAASGPGNLDRIVSELRVLAAEANETPWGRLAALYADEIGQTEALRFALQRAGIDLSVRDAKLRELETTLAQERAQAAVLTGSIEAAKDERAADQRAMKDLEEQLATREATIATLEAELEALKRIDMARNP